MQQARSARQPPKRATVADKISIELQRMILDGDPGKPLPSQRDIAEKFGASRTSVREAIAALEASGLVQVEHGRGVFVRMRSNTGFGQRPPSWSFDGTLALRDAYQIRTLIEPYAVRIVTPVISRQLLARLSETVDKMRDHMRSGDYVAMAKEDFAFHWNFAEQSGNQLFCDILSRCASLLPLTPCSSEAEMFAEHAAVIAEVAAGRAENAADAMYRHVVSAARRAQIMLPDVALFRPSAGGGPA